LLLHGAFRGALDRWVRLRAGAPGLPHRAIVARLGRARTTIAPLYDGGKTSSKSGALYGRSTRPGGEPGRTA
jgi:hypothetical protein